MAVNMKGKSFLTLRDLSSQEIRYLLDLAHDLKAKKRMGVYEHNLANKNTCFCLRKLRRVHAALLRWRARRGAAA